MKNKSPLTVSNGVNPYKALVKLFTELPKAQTIEEYERLAELLLSPKNTT